MNLIHFEEILEKHPEINDMYIDSVCNRDNDLTPSESIDYMIQELELNYIKVDDEFYINGEVNDEL